MSGTILITGTTSGFGQAMARLFVQNGWKVIGTGRRADRLEKLKTDLGEAFHALVFDIMDEAATTAALAGLPEDFQEIDILVNNAGLALGTASAPATKLSDWKTMIDTNITGLVTITDQLLPKLIERKGMVVNISSIAANWPYPGGNVYAGTKAFLRQFSLGLRSDLHGKGCGLPPSNRAYAKANSRWCVPEATRKATMLFMAAPTRSSRKISPARSIGSRHSPASQHQLAGTDARQPVLGRLADRQRGLR